MSSATPNDDHHLASVDQLQEKVQLQGYRFAAFAVCFYFAVPILYYWAYVGYTPLDAFYFIVVTFSSVGYGDITPVTKSQKIWTCFFILVGVTVTANMVGVLTSVVQERREKQLTQAKNLLHNPDMKPTEVTCLQRIGLCWAFVWEKLEQLDGNVRTMFDKVTGYSDVQIQLLERRLTGEVRNSDLLKEQATGDNDGFFSWFFTPNPSRASAHATYDHRILNHSTQVAIQDLRRMKQQLHRDTQDMRYQSFHDFVWIWVMILIGANSMQVIEDWKLNDAYYWSVVTITTVGYGDVVPTTKAGKVFTIFFILIGTGLMANTLGNLIMAPINIRKKKNEIQVMEQFEASMTADYFNALVHNPMLQQVPLLKRREDELTKAEFMLVVLSMMNKVEDSDLLTASRIFDRYDVKTDGFLSEEVIKLHFSVAQQKEKAETKAGKNRRPSYIHVYNGDGVPGDGAAYATANPLAAERRASHSAAAAGGQIQPQGHGQDLEEARRSISLQKYSSSDPNPTTVSTAGTNPVDGGDPSNTTTPYAAMK